MRIAVVHSFYTDANPSGESQAVLDQVDTLRAAGHSVEVFARHTDLDSKQHLYKVRSALHVANLTGPDPSPEIAKFNPDIVHIHNLFPNWGTSWLGKWSDRSVATLHNFRTICAAGFLFRDGHECTECLDHGSSRAVVHACYKDSAVATVPLAFATRRQGKYAPTLHKPRRLIAHTRASVALIERLVQHEVDLVPYFVRDTKLDRSDVAADSWTFIGRLSPEKGIDWLIENWPRHERLTIIGSGALQPVVEAAAAREPEVFRYLGQRPYHEARSVVAGSKGVLVCSRWPETGPLTAIEALQSGTPLAVAANLAQADELTKNGAGVQFSIEDGAQGLAKALAELTNGAASRDSARQRFESEFSSQVWLSRAESVYRKIINREVVGAR